MSLLERDAVGLKLFKVSKGKMFLPLWSLWWVFLTLHMSACGLEIYENNNKVICSQGLSQCTVKDEMSFPVPENDAVDVQKLTPHFKLCCRKNASCTLCLVIDTELYIHLDKDPEDEGSGPDEEDYRDETRNPKVSVTICYKTPPTFPTCKKVKFMVNRAAFAQQHSPKVSIVITKPAGVFLGSEISVFLPKSTNLSQQVVAPSLDEVCAQEEERVEECRCKKEIPRLSIIINKEMNRVELQFAERNKSLPFICLQYELSGVCRIWNRTTIPLYSVAPCMCLQVWDEDEQSCRLLSCPFKNKGATVNGDFIQRNIWQNVSVSVSQGRMNNYDTMLWWHLSAPCKLDGEVWPCHKEDSCREVKGFRQQLAQNGTWRQNSKGLWEKNGVFEDIDLQLSPCVMVKVRGMGHELGPFCFTNTNRWHWSLLLMSVTLLVCMTALIFHFLNDFVKNWAERCHHGGFVKINRKAHVVLLSPPDADNGVSESVCQLGSLLCKQGFSVSVDQWSRKEQCSLGPLPWLHSQLLELNSLGGRVVLVLTHKVLVRTAEWTHQHKEVETMVEDEDLRQIWSPYSDVFAACLCLIEAEKQLGRAGERFLLVKFDSSPSSDMSLPELLQGLPLFQLPSQIQALLSELTVGGTGRGTGGRTWKGKKWAATNACRAKTKVAEGIIM